MDRYIKQLKSHLAIMSLGKKILKALESDTLTDAKRLEYEQLSENIEDISNFIDYFKKENLSLVNINCEYSIKNLKLFIEVKELNEKLHILAEENKHLKANGII